MLALVSCLEDSALPNDIPKNLRICLMRNKRTLRKRKTNSGVQGMHTKICGAVGCRTLNLRSNDMTEKNLSRGQRLK